MTVTKFETRAQSPSRFASHFHPPSLSPAVGARVVRVTFARFEVLVTTGQPPPGLTESAA